jgi:hypothetical protein
MFKQSTLNVVHISTLLKQFFCVDEFLSNDYVHDLMIIKNNENKFEQINNLFNIKAQNFINNNALCTLVGNILLLLCTRLGDMSLFKK